MARLTENLNLQRGFLRHLDKLESIQVLQKLKVESIQPEVDSNGWPLVHLSDGTTIRARLLIASNVGADGFSSPVRSYAGISSYGWSYDTQAVVATLNRAPRGAFERPNHIAYQRFLPTGPIAFLPLSPTVSSLVWSTRLRHAAALCKSGPDVLASMINAAFRLPEVSIRYLHDRILEAEAAGATLSHDAIKDEIAFRERSNNISKYPAYALPSLRLPSQAGTIASFPLRYNHTEAYLGEGAGSRTVLMGDAAHTIHPLAGQGLDLGLGDVECPARCIDQTLKHGGDIGSYTALRPYASERYFENHKVMSAVDKLHKLYSSTVEPIISKDTFAPSSRSGSSEPISEDTIYQAPPQNKGSALFPSLLVSLPSYPLSASRDVEGVFLMLGLITGGNKSVTIFITVLRLIIPQVCSLNISPQEEWFKDIQKDRGRAVYGLKEKNLAKAYIKLIPLGMKDPDASRLLNWKRPSGKFVESKRSSVVEGSLSVDDLNGILDELSKNIGKQDVQSKILQRIYNRSTAEEQKWMVRIILKDMVISVKEITVFSVFHPDAEDLLNTCSDLKKVAWELSDPTRRLKAELFSLKWTEVAIEMDLQGVLWQQTYFAHALARKQLCMTRSLILPDILLAEDPKPDAPSMLANSLWYKYRTSPDWSWKVKDNTVVSLRQVPLMTLKRHMIALQYAQFLLHVDQHLPAGIDEQVLRWLLGTGKNENLALTADAGDVFTIVLIFLCAYGTISGNLHPIRKRFALFDSLVLRLQPQISSTFSNAVLDIHRSYTHRQDAFGELHFGFLAAEMPILVSIEHNSFVPQYLRGMARVPRVRTCESRQFRFAAYRDLDVIQRVFEQPIQSGSIDERPFEPLVNALKAILSDSREALSGTDVNAFLNSGISSALSPWRLAATAVQLQFGLWQLGRAMANDSTRQAASASPYKMTSIPFHHSEACFIAEMVKEIDSAVAETFVINGMKSLGTILLRPLTPAVLDSIVERIDRAGEILRLLSHVILNLSVQRGPSSDWMLTVRNDSAKLYAQHSLP
ncbi:hypothetical protein JVU11DRAFT_9170 [Chiua virens]|nr:hypothetical protein JVU11DRAFT_9170 [Chiua virens]